MLKTSIIKSIITLTFLVWPISTFAFSTKAPYAILIDSNTDAVLYSKNADSQIPPSSMSKLMSVYMAFHALSQNTISMDDSFTVNEDAWKVGGSTMFLEPNDKVTVKDLLRGTIIQSGNDACYTLAAGIAGTEQRFVDQMNNMAKKIGLKNSHFANSTGLPDDNHYMSLTDIAILSKKLIKEFPDFYPMFSEKEFSYHNITQPNRNYLIGEHGIDGLKTGHTDRGGYGIAISAIQDDRRLIAIVNGLSNESERIEEAKKLMLHGFQDFDNHHIASANKPIAKIDVWHGSESSVGAISENDIILSLPKEYNFQDAKIHVQTQKILNAPIIKGEHIADLVITFPNNTEHKIKLVSDSDSERATYLEILFDNLAYKIKHL